MFVGTSKTRCFQTLLIAHFVRTKTVPRSDPINRPKTSQNHLGRYHLPKIWLSTQPFESVKNIRARLRIMKATIYMEGLPQKKHKKTTWRSVMVDLVGISWFNGLNLVSTLWDMPISSSSMVTGYPLQLWARGLFTRRNQRSKSGDRTREVKMCAKWG